MVIGSFRRLSYIHLLHFIYLCNHGSIIIAASFLQSIKYRFSFCLWKAIGSSLGWHSFCTKLARLLVLTSSTALLKFNCTVSAAVCIHKAYICSCVGLSFCYNLGWLHPGWTRGVCGLHFYSAVQGELNGSTWSQQSPTGLASRYFSSLLCWRMELYGGLQARFGESLTKNDLPVVPSLAHRDLNWMELWFFLNHNTSEIINGHQDLTPHSLRMFISTHWSLYSA